MGQISVSITKVCAFRDSIQHFSNVYTYGSLFPAAGAVTEADAIIDKIVTMEKGMHSTDVTFEHARLWSSGGSIAENQMLYEKDLTGAGTLSALANFDRERAFLCQWPAGLDSRGRKVYLRKWYHSCGNPTGTTFTVGVVENKTAMTSAGRAAIAAKVGVINRVGGAADWGLVAPSGRERDDNLDPLVHPYIEHHQLGDEWRG